MSDGEALQKQLDDLTRLVVVPTSPLTQADDQHAKRALKNEKGFYDDDLHEQAMADRESARVQREKYASRIFYLVSTWIGLIFLLLLAQGFGDHIGYKPLSDKVLITLISSTTVNVIGTLIIVLKYIFKTQGTQTGSVKRS